MEKKDGGGTLISESKPRSVKCLSTIELGHLYVECQGRSNKGMPNLGLLILRRPWNKVWFVPTF